MASSWRLMLTTAPTRTLHYLRVYWRADTPSPRSSFPWSSTVASTGPYRCTGSHFMQIILTNHHLGTTSCSVSEGIDVLPGNHIELLRFPGNAFEVTGTQVVPTVAGMHALLAATPTATLVGPFHDGDPDTQVIRSRKVLPVPPAYINIILDKTLTLESYGTSWEEPSSPMGGKRNVSF